MENIPIIIAHASDLHYCEKHLLWVEAAMTSFVEAAIAAGADVAILTGDSFDHQLGLHDPAVHAYLRQVSRLAEHMPVLVLQGTFSHDRPGSLEVLRTLRGKHPIHVAERIHQVALIGGGWVESEAYRFERITRGALDEPPKLIVSCLPSIHKGTVKAMAGDDASAADLVEKVCIGWGETNLVARANGIPTVLVTHGTVNGSVTESKYAMVSPDHEFSPGILWTAQTSAVMVGHIHAHNAWEHEGRWIAYPGSITRLVFGHNEQTYWLCWNVDAEGSSFDTVPTPGRQLIEIEFGGPPDMEKLRIAAAECAGAYVRVRWSVDEEHRHTIDQPAMREILAAACDVKLEGSINPVQRTRSAGLTRTESVHDKLGIWGKVTDIDTDPLQSRLTDLQIHDVDQLLAVYAEHKTEVSNAAN